MKHFLILIFFQILACLSSAKESPIDTTFINNNLSIHVTTKIIGSESVLLLAICNSKIVLNDTIDYAYFNIEFVDFNKDGNTDIKSIYGGNNFTNYLYLFNPTVNVFKSVVDFIKYPEAIKLKTNPNYYYSYHRAGCADMIWVSDLFLIEDYTAIHVGHIYGQGCDAPFSIQIFKVENNDDSNERLIEKLPYEDSLPESGSKLDFIEDYWNRNHSKFQ